MTEHLRNALEWVQSLGPWGPIAFIVLYVAATVAFLPGSLLTLGAGALFGLSKGTAIVSIASTLGATAAFIVARYIARGWVARKLRERAKLEAVDEAIKRGGWRVILLMRLSPAFPFNLFNYAAGLTDVPLGHYVFGSWLGMLPATILFVYIGSLARSLSALGGARERTPLELGFYGVGLLATIAVTIYVTRLARRALHQRLKEQG